MQYFPPITLTLPKQLTDVGGSPGSATSYKFNGPKEQQIRTVQLQPQQHYSPLYFGGKSQSSNGFLTAVKSPASPSSSSSASLPSTNKFNYTPFTASNAVPGHFVPIVFTPLTLSNSNPAPISSDNNSNNPNNGIVNSPTFSPQQQQQQHQQQQPEIVLIGDKYRGQQQHNHYHQQQPSYYSVTTSPILQQQQQQQKTIANQHQQGDHQTDAGDNQDARDVSGIR